MATDNRPRPCTRCEVEAGRAYEEDGVILNINPEWLPCALCGEPTCVQHGRDYRAGFEHEECHESPANDRGVGVI